MIRNTYSATTLDDEFERLLLPGRLHEPEDRTTWLEDAAEEIFAQIRYRLKDTTVTEGKHPITLNEVIGIIAKHEAARRS
jgi:hypothetical protein